MTNLEDEAIEIITFLIEEKGYTHEEIEIIGELISERIGNPIGAYEIVEETLESWEPDGDPN